MHRPLHPLAFPVRFTLLSGILALATPPVLAQSVPVDVVWTQAVGASTVAFSPDGRLVASGGLLERVDDHSAGRLDLFDAADGAPRAHAETHGAAVIGTTNGLAFSPDGATLATANGDLYCDVACLPDRTGLLTWSVPGLVPIVAATLEEHDLPRSVAFALAGPPRLAAGYSGGGGPGGELGLHHGTTLALERALFGDTYITAAVAFSPDGRVLASVGGVGYLKLWDADTGELLRQVQHGQNHNNGIPLAVAFSPDGERIVTAGSGGDARVRVWRTSDLLMLRDLDAHVSGGVPGSAYETVVAYAPNGRYVIGGLTQRDPGGNARSAIRFWDAATGAVVQEVDAGAEGIAAIAVSAAHAHYFAYSTDTAVRVARTTLTLSDGTTATDDAPVAGAFRLAHAGPNPSPTPALTLTVGEAQHVRAEAFDALGRRVAVLHDGAVAAGAPVRLAPAGLAPGPYVVRVVGEGFTEARTVVVVR